MQFRAAALYCAHHPSPSPSLISSPLSSPLLPPPPLSSPLLPSPPLSSSRRPCSWPRVGSFFELHRQLANTTHPRGPGQRHPQEIHPFKY
eukprot:757790-Hanusia_phi.AAC.1